MITKFKVHGVSRIQATRTVKMDGQDVQAQVPCLEVELMTEDAASGSLTLRFFGDKIEAATEMFQPDAELNAEWNAG
jgi:hypothetical protein